MVVRDFDVDRAKRPCGPFEANSPLVVYANTVLASAAMFADYCTFDFSAAMSASLRSVMTPMWLDR
jgi:hypothetical protein